MANKFIYLVSVSLCVFITGSNGQSAPCTTPGGDAGSCVELTMCAPLFALVQSRPIPPENADYLRSHHCGYRGLIPKVCCSAKVESMTVAPRVASNPRLPDRTVCGETSEDRIFGGNRTRIDEYPWMAMLEYTKGGNKGFFCGGMLISDRYILTAGHCIKSNPNDWVLTSVRLGEWDTSTGTDCEDDVCSDPTLDVGVETSFAHPGYIASSVDQQNDIGLVRLNRRVAYTDWIKPICLPATGGQQKSYVGDSLIVAGWGRTETSARSEVKLKLRVTVQDLSVCSAAYRATGQTLGRGQMCAGGRQGQDSCRGDSGGPLMAIDNSGGMVTMSIAGIVSYGPTPCGQPGWPGVYAKVADYMPWISENVRA